MMKYRNKRTGNVIIVPCPVSGPDWEELVEAKAEPEVAPGKKAASKKAATKAVKTDGNGVR